MRMTTTELSISLLHVYLAQTQEKGWEYLDKACDTQDKNKTPKLFMRQKAEVGDQQHSALTHFELYPQLILRPSLNTGL